MSIPPPSCSGESHQSEDWDAIHERICEVVMVLRGPLPHDSTQEERLHTKQQQMHRKASFITRMQLLVDLRISSYHIIYHNNLVLKSNNIST